MDVIYPVRIMAKKADKRRKQTKRIITSRVDINYNPYLSFEPYTGHRFQIPAGIRVSESIKQKFGTLETHYPSIIIHKLNSLIKGSEYYFNKLPFSTAVDPITLDIPTTWVPPENVKSYILAYQTTNVKEWSIVKSIYLRIFKMNRFLSGLINRWRINKCIKNVKNLEDPVTLDAPNKLVRVLDFPRRLSYIFEASTLRKTIESRITHSDYMFPNPLAPINPFTNSPFTRGQLLSIITQCKKLGEFSWILDRLYGSDGDLVLFALRFRQPLKILAIENHFKGSVDKYIEEVLDFFQVEADRDELPEDKIASFQRRMRYRPGCEFVREWIQLTRDLYIARELQDVLMLATIHIKSTSAIGRAYYLLN